MITFISLLTATLVTTAPVSLPPSVAHLNLQNTYSAGETIQIKVTNDTSGNITIDEMGQCHRFFRVFDRNNNELSLLDPLALCTMDFRSITLAPFETKVVDTWNQKFYTNCPPGAQCVAPPYLQVGEGPYSIQVNVASPIHQELRKTIVINTPTTTFKDVPASYWAYSYIMDLYTRRIVRGYGNGNFGPENSITRAEVVKIAVNAALAKGLHRDTISSCFPDCPTLEIPVLTFEDVPPSHAMFRYIEIAEMVSIIESGTYFYPDRPATRFECLQILLNAFQKQNEISMFNASSAQSFSDVAAPMQRAYTDYAANEGIVSGQNNNFYPNQSVRRSEIAKIAYNLLIN
ncbi:MAG: S-layer homology domain-containing protein [Candidatus Abawacabacteria bacterium]|nr:S-layer homology domain-containing protein [Candidatus Abawacabacteria bacterium]